MKFQVIIPARYASTRFPGKPLAMLGGKPVIQHVYEQARKAVSDVCVATDDERIYNAVTGFGGMAVMTSPDHKSGTDRICEAFVKLQSDADVVINIQGDEPFIRPEQISALKDCFSHPDTQIATLACPFEPQEDIFDTNIVKVVFSAADNRALYFSRSPLPYLRGVGQSEWAGKHTYYAHIGVYAYRADTLCRITRLPQSPLEKAESLEQLRWLEAGIPIYVGITESGTIGIDTLDDLHKAELYLLNADR